MKPNATFSGKINLVPRESTSFTSGTLSCHQQKNMLDVLAKSVVVDDLCKKLPQSQQVVEICKHLLPFATGNIYEMLRENVPASKGGFHVKKNVILK